MFVGIDANGDGKIDLFVGVCNSGSANAVGIWNPGNGLNVSPSTTSMVSPPIVSYVETASNYNWTRLSSTIDPTVGTATDINGDTQPDYFLSLSVPFADVLTQLAAEGITVNQNSTFSYVIATATQDNSLNQDLNGVNGGVNSSLTWAQLGAISDPLTAGGIAVVPEVNAFWPVTAVLAAAAVGARRRRRC
jgi:hypothetical protein